MKKLAFALVLLFLSMSSFAQQNHSVARQWNEVLLEAIRNDFARPTVHARNLFHSSVLMYDAWAVYDEHAQPYFLGDTLRNFVIPFDTLAFDSLVLPNIAADSLTEIRLEAISYAAYRLLRHRFAGSPGASESIPIMDALFVDLGYDSSLVSTDYLSGSPAALGNYLAQQMIAFGMQDGANEAQDYANRFYRPWNPSIAPEIPGNRFFFNQNRWQPLTFDVFIDQSGNPIPGGAPEFLSPEWGQVVPFALEQEDLTIYNRNGSDYWVYHDPGDPCYIDVRNGGGFSDKYKWGFTMVSEWGAHLDPADSVIWDISPASIGNIAFEDYPTDIEGLRNFYRPEGGDPSQGHAINPHTGLPYEPQFVPRGDYTRVLAEFWADGPDSETPPGHWFTILNYVNDHPLFEKRYKGEGKILDELEWDVKAYLTLGGAMHDCAVTAWGIKGWYDYPRPISTIRWMAEQGQSTSDTLPSYSINGLVLKEGLVELVEEGDSLAGENNEHVGKIKLYTWRGPDYIESPDTSVAGVGWILGENWWPYQRPTFVTPPFAGYVSGHSTYSRAAAEVMTLLTGDAFFPGGIGTFEVEKNEFLVFEDGPSIDFELQWATYRDASDQTSLSRIWGGIHPPVDDVPGRLIGIEVGLDAFAYAEQLFNVQEEVQDSVISSIYQFEDNPLVITPNPVVNGSTVHLTAASPQSTPYQLDLFNLNGQLLQQAQFEPNEAAEWTIAQNAGVYILRWTSAGKQFSQKLVVIE
ncbi:MAG: T9SS type A sorting domain-containing protein [Bacteroidota bacterium]